MRRRIYEMIEKGEQEDKISLYYDRFIIFCIIASVLPLCEIGRASCRERV